MSRWTNTDAFIRSVVKSGLGAEFINSVTTLVIDTPTIDLVRCGECKYWGNSYICWRRRAKPIAMNPDDFCSYGERKET